MKIYKIISVVLLVFLLTSLFYFYSLDRNKEGEKEVFHNKVEFTTKVTLTDLEKEQLIKSVDGFMNEYKLPKGVQNSYRFDIEKRLNDSIQILVNLGQEQDSENIIIHARKINNVWEVDPNGGPWCTLENFDDKTCF